MNGWMQKANWIKMAIVAGIRYRYPCKRMKSKSGWITHSFKMNVLCSVFTFVHKTIICLSEHIQTFSSFFGGGKINNYKIIKNTIKSRKHARRLLPSTYSNQARSYGERHGVAEPTLRYILHPPWNLQYIKLFCNNFKP